MVATGKPKLLACFCCRNGPLDHRLQTPRSTSTLNVVARRRRLKKARRIHSSGQILMKGSKTSSTLDRLACLVSDRMQACLTLFLLSFQDVRIYSCVKSFRRRRVWPFDIVSMTLGGQLMVFGPKLPPSSLHGQFLTSRGHCLGNDAATSVIPSCWLLLRPPTSMICVSADFLTISSMALPRPWVALVPRLARKPIHPQLLVSLPLAEVSKYRKRNKTRFANDFVLGEMKSIANEARQYFFQLRLSFRPSSWMPLTHSARLLQEQTLTTRLLRKLVPWDSATESDLEELLTAINNWRESAAIVIPATPTSQRRARKKSELINLLISQLHNPHALLCSNFTSRLTPRPTQPTIQPTFTSRFRLPQPPHLSQHPAIHTNPFADENMFQTPRPPTQSYHPDAPGPSSYAAASSPSAPSTLNPYQHFLTPTYARPLHYSPFASSGRSQVPNSSTPVHQRPPVQYQFTPNCTPSNYTAQFCK